MGVICAWACVCVGVRVWGEGGGDSGKMYNGCLEQFKFLKVVGFWVQAIFKISNHLGYIDF